MAPSCRTALSRAPPAQEEWGCPEGAKPPWRLFGDFLSVQKVTGVRGEQPRAFSREGIYSEEKDKNQLPNPPSYGIIPTILSQKRGETNEYGIN